MLLDGLLAAEPFRIVDVGARDGVHPRWPRDLTRFQAVLFEPEPEEYARLKARLSGNYVVLAAALSDARTRRTLHVCRSAGASSLHRPNLPFLNLFPENDRFQVAKTVEVETDTLDAQLDAAGLPGPDLIKIDVQGHELAILSGASAAVDAACGLELEVEFAAMYEGQPLFADVDAFARSRGFTLFDLSRTFWQRSSSRPGPAGSRGQLIFGDVLYLRAPEAVAAGPEPAAKALTAYLAYGYTDLAEHLLALRGPDFSPAQKAAAAKALAGVRRRAKVSGCLGRRFLAELRNRLAKARRGRTWYERDDRLGNGQ